MIIIIYSVCPIFTNPVDWLKTLSNGVKTHLLKLKTSKFSLGATPPPCTPRSGCGEAGKGLLGEKIRGWEKLKKEKMVFLILNL